MIEDGIQLHLFGHTVPPHTLYHGVAGEKYLQHPVFVKLGVWCANDPDVGKDKKTNGVCSFCAVRGEYC